MLKEKKTVWFLGYGKFGQRGVRKILEASPSTKITVVDRVQPVELPEELNFEQAEAVSWLVERLTCDSCVDIIVPAVPVHLAAQWLQHILTNLGHEVQPQQISRELLASLPNCYPMSVSQVAVSFADFSCPNNCPEPEGYCTVTGESRKIPMYDFLPHCDFPVTPYVIRSKQLAPGLGGYNGTDLIQLLNHVLNNTPEKLFIATACKCHGIVDGIEITF